MVYHESNVVHSLVLTYPVCSGYRCSYDQSQMITGLPQRLEQNQVCLKG